MCPLFLQFIPMPVLYGVFLYMGASSLKGIQVEMFTFHSLSCFSHTHTLQLTPYTLLTLLEISPSLLNSFIETTPTGLLTNLTQFSVSLGFSSSLSVLRPLEAVRHASQTSAGFHLPSACPFAESSPVHHHAAHLSHTAVGHQDVPRGHRVPYDGTVQKNGHVERILK